MKAEIFLMSVYILWSIETNLTPITAIILEVFFFKDVVTLPDLNASVFKWSGRTCSSLWLLLTPSITWFYFVSSHLGIQPTESQCQHFNLHIIFYHRMWLKCQNLAYWPQRDEPQACQVSRRPEDNRTSLTSRPAHLKSPLPASVGGDGNSHPVPSASWWCRRAPTPSWRVSPASGWSGPSSSCSAVSAASCSAGWSATTRRGWGSNVCAL